MKLESIFVKKYFFVRKKGRLKRRFKIIKPRKRGPYASFLGFMLMQW
jgi:hypothetical protein